MPSTTYKGIRVSTRRAEVIFGSDVALVVLMGPIIDDT